MLWVVVDILLVLASLVALALVLLGLWRKVRDLGHEVVRAGEAIAQATDDLARVQAQTPPSA
ncbi:MAG: hypothetical protein QOE05_2016 [Actinomycetota bacterium]|nr:hypothetical protein [Actinomycetota bacterium]